MENRCRVKEQLLRFRLEGLAKRFPGELSGGQQQRVALARIFACEPRVILLDEPFSALDAFLRDQLLQELMETLADYDGTVVFVSHNRDEIYRFSQELLIIDEGRQVCFGDTRELTLTLKREVPSDLHYVGIRAHMFEPVWGDECPQNAVPFHLYDVAEYPFEYKYYSHTPNICWYVQKSAHKQIGQRGMPQFLRLPEEELLLLT